MKDRLNYLFDGVAVAATLAQTKEIFQIVSFVLTCLSVVLSISYTIYKWYRKASADGVITKEEIKDGIEEIKKEFKK